MPLTRCCVCDQDHDAFWTGGILFIPCEQVPDNIIIAISRREFMPAKCSSCGAEIIWAKVIKKDGGQGNMPFDPNHSPEGTHQLAHRAVKKGNETKQETWAYFVPRGERAGKTTLRVSHFATCPNADDHRKSKEPQPPDDGEMLF